MVSILMDKSKRKLITILAILKSRRLLSDHSEVLEECLSNGYINSETFSLDKYLNGATCTLLSTSTIITSKFASKRSVRFQMVVEHLIVMLTVHRIGITLCALASGYAILCLSKLVLYGKLWILHKSVLTLLHDMDEFDACTRRSISYFRENAIFQSSQQSSPEKVNTTSADLTTCTESLILVLKAIYDVVVSLEKTSIPSKVDNLFNPLENLSEHLDKTFNKPTTSNLKELYNIFLYIQSHLLTRLSLILIFDSSQSHLSTRKKCSFLSDVIKAEIFKENLRYEQMTTASSTESDHPNSIDHVTLEPIVNLKSYSISASSKLLAIANECRRIDGIVQSVYDPKNDKLAELMPSITQIENAIHVCQSEYQRFVVAYFKVMNVTLNYPGSDTETAKDENEFVAECETLRLKLQEMEPDEEEFFTSTERTSDDESKELYKNRRCWDDELTEKNINVVKQRFKPVLNQLKGKIEPIAKSLRERERNHLLSKGIDPSEFVDCNKINEGFRSCSESEDDDDDCIRRNKSNRYDDMRKFLEGKHQISLIPMRSATDNFLSEDILE